MKNQRFGTALLAMFLGFFSCATAGCAIVAPDSQPLGPSPYARAVLEQLEGSTLLDASNLLGAGEWVVGPFAVIESPAYGGNSGPVVGLESGVKVFFIPIEREGDVADLARRTGDNRLFDFEDQFQSSAYLSAWIGKSAQEVGAKNLNADSEGKATRDKVGY